MTFISTKTYGHEVGLSCCFRQHRAESHCRYLHGYALSVKFEFEAVELDYLNWVVDFGGLKSLKAWLESTFDHKLLMAEDDPQRREIVHLHDLGVIDLIMVPATGCESFAYYVFLKAKSWLIQNEYAPRVRLRSVEIREHGANSAIYSE